MSNRRLATRSSDTAEINALQRAAETRNAPDRRLIEDEFASAFVQRRFYRLALLRTGAARTFLRFLDRSFPGLHAVIILRARYVDAALTEAPPEQLVLLGAGYDSTAFRHRLDGATIFEVDAPSTQAAKRAAIERAGIAPATPVAFVPCDFEHVEPATALLGAGFDPERPALVVWLGVSYYLSLDAFRRTLGGLGPLLAPGSRLILDYMDPAVIDGTSDSTGARRLARSVERRGEPYRLGLTREQLTDELRAAALQLDEHVRISDLAERFGGPAGVWCRTDDFVSLVSAERRSG